MPDYELVRKMAVAYLDQARATEMDTSRIDESIRYAANAFAEDVRDALEVGMDAHVAKPVDMLVL